MTVEFVLDDLLNPPHKDIFTDDSRFIVAACGRRFGKTYLSVYKLLIAAYSNPNRTYYYLAPNLAQAREIVWEVLKDKAIDQLVAKTNEARLEITFINGARIALKSAERPDSLRGVSLSGIILDEVASFRYFEDIWQKVIRPALSDQKGFAWFISSPSGRDWFYDLYNQANGKNDWQAYQYTTLDGGYVDDDEIETAKSELSPQVFRQEYLATFESFSGLVVPHFDRDTHLEHDFKLLPNEAIHAGIDLNISIMPIVFCVIRNGVVIAFDEIIGALDTPELLEAIEQRYDLKRITAYPDNSSGQRSSIGADKTSLKMFKAAFRLVRTKSKNPRIMDRVNAFNSMVMSGDNTIRFRVTPNCKSLIESLEKHTYNDAGMPDKRGGHDHMFDAISYLTLWHSPLTKNVTKIQRFRL